jgi:hypothetical protein
VALVVLLVALEIPHLLPHHKEIVAQQVNLLPMDMVVVEVALVLQPLMEMAEMEQHLL